MTSIISERMTVAREKGIVIFLIGARINRWWKIHKWLPVALAMQRMLRELKNNPNSGFLGAMQAGTTMIQYWESVDQLHVYAKDRSAQHFPAWTAFYRSIGTNGDVGIWHETYVVQAGQLECIYLNMPRFGLGLIEPLVPARGNRQTARDRLNPVTDAVVPPE